MMIIDDLRAHIGDILACDIELDEDEQQFIKVVFPPRTQGRPLFMKKLAEFHNNSHHKDAVNQKTNGDTVLQWINPLREIGIMNNQNAGRSSVPDNRAGGWRADGSASAIPERSFCGNERSRATSGMQNARDKCFINQSPE
jgi:hypothetical protein